ncbi:trna ligase [Coemansia sp. RSA 988]|nr:trna ligase [Coemansia sp. RSA 988]
MTSGPLTKKEEYDFRQLLTQMQELSKADKPSKRVVRQSTYQYEGHDVTSWKCTEYLYKKDPCPLPTKARGLFTGIQDGEKAIIARGYDKFFNIDEVVQTKWSWIEENTHGPYELTVKENGCLILAASLDGGKTLLVTSKHAVNVPHAETGMKWMQQHLNEAGKTSEELAAFLHENNATAVFELCDDSFEEHILEYPERMRGLYLHGINRNAVELDTWPSADVTKVAERFGFRITESFNFDSADEGRAFADKVRNDHMLDGRAIEGFVVRCQLNGSDKPFMFKIKYDEPYLMFREWREMTKRIINDKPYRTTYPLSKRYAAWVKEQINNNPSDFVEYNNNKGIIAARKRFLDYHKSHGGNESEVYDQGSTGTKILLLPIATICCGKTTIALALSKLFGFGHVQNDDMPINNRRKRFHTAILNQFDNHNFVFADRNNHFLEQRQTLTTAIRKELVNCRIVCIYWSHEGISKKDIFKMATDRMAGRGENHQTLTPELAPNFAEIIRGFQKDFQPLDLESSSDSLIEDVIELNPMEDAKVNLQEVVDKLCDMFPDMLKRPSDAEVAEALESAFAYTPSMRQSLGGISWKKPAFFGLVPVDADIKQWLAQLLDSSSGDDWDICKEMLATGHHGRPPHITLVHNAATKGDFRAKTLYKNYLKLPFSNSISDRITAKCQADYLVCNSSSMALRIKSMIVKDDKLFHPSVVRRNAALDEGEASLITFNAIPHITLSMGKGVKAYQSNEMLLSVFGPENADSPLDCPDGWAVIPVSLDFNATFARFNN